MGARYYDSAIGRFISRDPTGYAGSPINLYTYCADNPLKYTDPTGLYPAGWIVQTVGGKIVNVVVNGLPYGSGPEAIARAADANGMSAEEVESMMEAAEADEEFAEATLKPRPRRRLPRRPGRLLSMRR